MAIDLNRLTCYHTANGIVCLSCWLFQYRRQEKKNESTQNAKYKNPHFFHPFIWRVVECKFFLAFRDCMYIFLCKIILIPMQIAIDIHIVLLWRKRTSIIIIIILHVSKFSYSIFSLFLSFTHFCTFESCSFVHSKPGSRQFIVSIAMTKHSREEEQNKKNTTIFNQWEYWVCKHLTSNFLEIRTFNGSCHTVSANIIPVVIRVLQVFQYIFR